MVKAGYLVKTDNNTEFYEVVSLEEHLVPQILSFFSRFHREQQTKSVASVTQVWEFVRMSFPRVLISTIRTALELLITQGQVEAIAPDLFRTREVE